MIRLSPNPYGAARQTPRRIVVHAMHEWFDMSDAGTDPGMLYADKFLEHVGLSAHVLVTPAGEVIRCRDDQQGAYHAKGFNTDSLGIEFLVPNRYGYSYDAFLRAIEEDWVSEAQLLTGGRVIAEWIARWGITQIDGHCDLDPARKRDPGNFPWDRLRAAL